MVSADRIVAVISPESAPIKRVIQDVRDKGMLVDASFGRSTKAVLVMDSGHVILSALTPEALAAVIEAGATRAIIGSAALDDPEFLAQAVELYGDRIAVGIDARNGFVQTKGWVETTKTLATDLAAAVAKAGVKTIIYTDTATDGMLGGPNLTQMAAICDAAPTCQITASGGVSSPFDIENLKALERANLRAAIVGKALYDGRTTLKEMNVAAL